MRRYSASGARIWQWQNVVSGRWKADVAEFAISVHF